MRGRSRLVIGALAAALALPAAAFGGGQGLPIPEWMQRMMADAPPEMQRMMENPPPGMKRMMQAPGMAGMMGASAPPGQ